MEAGDSYSGHFYGNGKELKVSLVSDEQFCALFRCVKDATITNLKVSGIILTTAKFAGSLVGQAKGSNYVSGCHIRTILWSQVNGNGTLNAASNKSNENTWAAGIGGGYGASNGNIVIKGGVINAIGGEYASGIGSSYNTNGGYIRIEGGRVNATGGRMCPGMGHQQNPVSFQVCLLPAILQVVEKAFRVSKGNLEMRPIFHFTERRIEAHICICFVAYKVYKELERVIRHAAIAMSVDKGRAKRQSRANTECIF